MNPEIKNSLKELGFKENEIKIYLAATELGEATASQIAKKASLPRTTAISLLLKLEENHYLSTHKYKGTTYFWIESPKILKESFESKIAIAEKLDSILTDVYHSESDFPFAKVYDSKQSIKKFIEKTLLNLKKKSTIYTIDNPHAGNYDKIFPDDYGKTLAELKNKKQIITHTLVPYGSYKMINPDKLKRQNFVIRELPPTINYPSSLWIIDDMVVHFSGKYPFIVAINHRLITDSLRSVYQFLWDAGKSVI